MLPCRHGRFSLCADSIYVSTIFTDSMHIGHTQGQCCLADMEDFLCVLTLFM